MSDARAADARVRDARRPRRACEPDPHYGSVIPAIHQTSTYAQPAPGEFVEDYDYARSANPTRARARDGARRARGRPRASRSPRGMAAEHALITAVCAAGDHVVLPARPLRRHLPARRQGARRAGASRTTSSTRPTSTRSPRAIRPETRLVWVETPTNPLLNVVDIAGVVARTRRRARRRRQHVRHAGQPAPARARRRLRRALDDEVPRRPLRHGRRRGRSPRDAELHERLRFVQNAVGAVPGPVRLLPRPPRAAHAAPAHGARTPRARAAVRRVPARRPRRRATSRWPGFSGMVSFRHPDARRRSRRARSSSRSPSRSAASSR